MSDVIAGACGGVRGSWVAGPGAFPVAAESRHND